jgi:hypothetical protein
MNDVVCGSTKKINQAIFICCYAILDTDHVSSSGKKSKYTSFNQNYAIFHKQRNVINATVVVRVDAAKTKTLYPVWCNFFASFLLRFAFKSESNNH